MPFISANIYIADLKHIHEQLYVIAYEPVGLTVYPPSQSANFFVKKRDFLDINFVNKI